MLTAYKRSRGETTLSQTADIEQGEWVRIEQPSEGEISDVAERLNLDISILKDALDPYEAPRFEVADSISYIFLRYPYSENPAGTAPLLIAVTKNSIVTIAPGTPSFMDRVASGSLDFYTTQQTKLLILFIAEITARYTTAMTSIQRSVNKLKQGIDTLSERDILEFATHEAAVNDYLDALIPQSNVLQKLSVGRTLAVQPEDRELIDDVILSTAQLVELGKSLLKTMENTRESHAAIATQRLNTVIRRLTALTVLVTIPNVITGFYGMNVLLPSAEHPNIVWFIIATITLIVSAIAAYLVWKKWF